MSQRSKLQGTKSLPRIHRQDANEWTFIYYSVRIEGIRGVD
jgi:hypothetical protein